MIFCKQFFRFFPVLLLCISLFLFISEHHAYGETRPVPSPTPNEIVSSLQHTYDTITSLSFTFSQSTRGQLSGRPKTGHGEAFFLRGKNGGKMRWNYTGAEPQVLVSDGETFSMYFAKLKQMMVTPAAAMQDDIMYSFFSGTGRLQDNFHISDPDPTVALPSPNSGYSPRVIKLTPKKPQSQVNTIHLFVSRDHLIRRVQILDHFDTLTVLDFADLKINSLEKLGQGPLDSLFTFTPPEGTEIIRQ